MSDFKIGDKVEILYHPNNEYRGKFGKINYIGAGMLQGTNPLDYNIDIPNQDSRIIIILDDNTVLSDMHDFQLRKA